MWLKSDCSCSCSNGTRWPLVKGKEVAKIVIKFTELSSIGVLKESQVRAAKILQTVSDSCGNTSDFRKKDNFFEISNHLLADRWKQLMEAIKHNNIFSAPKFPPTF